MVEKEDMNNRESVSKGSQSVIEGKGGVVIGVESLASDKMIVDNFRMLRYEIDGECESLPDELVVGDGWVGHIVIPLSWRKNLGFRNAIEVITIVGIEHESLIGHLGSQLHRGIDQVDHFLNGFVSLESRLPEQ